MKKTFKTFLIENGANVKDLDVFRNNASDSNQPVYDAIVKKHLEMEMLFSQHMEKDFDRILQHQHSMYGDFRNTWNAMVKSKKAGNFLSFMHNLCDDRVLVGKLAEFNSIYNNILKKTQGHIDDLLKEQYPAAERMLRMYELIVNYRERYV